MTPEAGGRRRPFALAMRLLRLLGPIIVPSWRFFDIIAASPRIDIAWSERPDNEPASWREFRPLPARLSTARHVLRLGWNPTRNATLFLVSCADRVCYENSASAAAMLRERLWQAVADGEIAREGRWLRYRLRTVERVDGRLVETVVHVDDASEEARAC